MIEPKERPCRGINKAKSYKGCGTPTLYRTMGLCNHCLGDFLFGNDNGKLLMQKSIIPKSKVLVKKESKAKDKETRQKLKTKSQYERELQQVINAIARYIDKDCLCISSRKIIPKGQEQGGHYISCSSHPALRFNLHNIHIQSVYDNMYKSGNPIGYMEGLILEYGDDYAYYVYGLKSEYPILKLSIDEIIESTRKAKELLKSLKNANITYSAEQRIRLRYEYNEYIGIYA